MWHGRDGPNLARAHRVSVLSKVPDGYGDTQPWMLEGREEILPCFLSLAFLYLSKLASLPRAVLTLKYGHFSAGNAFLHYFLDLKAGSVNTSGLKSAECLEMRGYHLQNECPPGSVSSASTEQLFATLIYWQLLEKEQARNENPIFPLPFT